MEIDEFLEHHGVKGQQWGVRTQQHQIKKSAKLSDKRDVNKANAADLTVKINKLDRKSAKVHPNVAKAKVAGVIAGTIAIGAGAIYAKKMLGSHGAKPVSVAKDWTHAKGPGWEISGNKYAVDTFVSSMMDKHYALQEIM